MHTSALLKVVAGSFLHSLMFFSSCCNRFAPECGHGGRNLRHRHSVRSSPRVRSKQGPRSFARPASAQVSALDSPGRYLFRPQLQSTYPGPLEIPFAYSQAFESETQNGGRLGGREPRPGPLERDVASGRRAGVPAVCLASRGEAMSRHPRTPVRSMGVSRHADQPTWGLDLRANAEIRRRIEACLTTS